MIARALIKRATQDSIKTVVDMVNTYLGLTKDACTKTSNNLHYYITTKISDAFYKQHIKKSEQANKYDDKIKAF